MSAFDLYRVQLFRMSAKFATEMELLRAVWSLVAHVEPLVNRAAARRTCRPSVAGFDNLDA